jgi:hypothetical protein
MFVELDTRRGDGLTGLAHQLALIQAPWDVLER